MGIAGPRLDRPSAVGDEGRPRAASQTIAALVVVGIAVAVTAVWSIVELLALLGFGVVLFVGGLGLLGRATVGTQVVGHVLYHAGAVAVVGVVIVALGGASYVLALGGLFVALLGVAASWANVMEREQLATTTQRAAVSYVAALAWLVGLVAGWLVVWAGGEAVRLVLDATTTAQSLSGGLGLAAVAGLLIRGACWAVPVAPLAPAADRGRYRAIARGLSRAGTAVAIASVVGVVAIAVYGPDRVTDAATADPALGPALGALSSLPVVATLVALSVVCGVAILVGLGAREVASQVDAGNVDGLAGALAGLLIAVAFGLLVLVVESIAALALVAPIVTIVVGFLVVAAIDWGAVPRRAGGPALATVGLLWAGVGVALANLPGPLVFACVAGAMVVWDCATFGLGLTVELGHRPETRRLELSHGVISIGVGAAVVLALTAIDWLHGRAGDAVSAWPAVALAVLGAVLLAVAIHRREG